MKIQWWGVYRVKTDDFLNTRDWKKIDDVPYDIKCDAEYVRRSLIDHDGYPNDIIVVLENI